MKYSFDLTEYYFYAFTFIRLSAFFFAAPIFAEPVVTPKIRVYLSFWITLVIAPLVHHVIPPDLHNPVVIFSSTLHEVMIGAAMALTMRFVFLALEFAGDIISHALSLSNASFASPGTGGGQISVTSNFLMTAGILLIFISDLHHDFIRILFESYELIPMGSFEMDKLTEMVVKSSELSISLGLKLATPIIIFGFLISIILGILNRLIPQVQIFIVSQPLQIGFGFFVFIYAIKEMMLSFLKHFQQFLSEWVT